MTTRTSLPPGARYLPDGRVKLTIDVPPGPDGKRRQRSRTVDTVGEAKTAYAELRASIDQGTYIEPASLTVNDYLDQWLISKVPTVKASTHAGYVDALKPVRRMHGHRKLQSIRKADIEAVLIKMTDRGRSGRTANLTLVVLRAALQSAVQQLLIPQNVAAIVARRREAPRQMTIWTVAEYEQFRAFIVDHPMRVGFELSCVGLRRGEVVGLQWGDVGPTELTIRNTLVTVNGQTQASTPKSFHSNRRLPFDQMPRVSEALSAARSAAGLRVRTPGATVLTDAEGRPLRPEFYGDELTRAMRAAGVPVIRVHDIRHTSVTLMLEGGMPDYLVAAWHGHDAATMKRSYAHATPNSLGRVAAAFAALGS